MTRRTDIDATALLFQRRRDAQHAHLNVECPRCKSTRPFRTLLCPDPHGHAAAINDRDAASWLRSHPCTATVYAHPRRVR